VVAGQGVWHPLKNSTDPKNLKKKKKKKKKKNLNKKFVKKKLNYYYFNFSAIFKYFSSLQHPLTSRH
jgi:hypothetical protein